MSGSRLKSHLLNPAKGASHHFVEGRPSGATVLRIPAKKPSSIVRSVDYQLCKREECMSVQTSERSASVVAFAPKKGHPDAAMLADDAGHGIIALLQKAADMAKQDCERAMDLAHKLSSQLRAAEERAREFEAEAIHFRGRAERAEDWLAHIHSHVEKTFFRPPGEKNESPLAALPRRDRPTA
jgi:hypothetical protein